MQKSDYLLVLGIWIVVGIADTIFMIRNIMRGQPVPLEIIILIADIIIIIIFIHLHKKGTPESLRKIKEWFM